MKRIYIGVALLAGLASCQMVELDNINVSSEENSPQKIMLKSMLEGRDTKWTVDDLAIPQEQSGWKLISNDKELAFLLEFGSTKGEKYRLANDITLTTESVRTNLPGEIGVERFENFEFDGNNKTISGLDLPLAAGLFSRVKDSKIYNLTLESTTIGAEDNVSNLLGTGAIIGSASGNVTLTGVVVSDCEVLAPCKVGGFIGSITDATATFTSCQVNGTVISTVYQKGISGWCGGFVGFIGRSEEKNTSSAVTVVADKCQVSGGNVQAHMESDTRYSGKFLGTLSGYDHQEVFKMNGCTVSTTFTGLDSKAQAYISKYPEGNIGGNKYMNGYIFFDDLLYASPWDGSTKAQPKMADGAYHVYTAEELAWFQGKTVTDKIMIHTDIDLAGYTFAPIYKASYIDGVRADGNNSEIRNLKVVRTNCGKEDGGAFIRQASGTTVHKNLTFRNADITATHDPDADHGNAYCATLCGNMTGTYTMTNVHAYDGKLYGVNKMGGLLGRVAPGTSGATISDCFVSGYYIENYEVDKPEDFGNSYISVVFYPQGEVGGMIGFIHGNANVSNCRVENTEIKAYGQDDKNMIILEVPGRHIGTVIGDIRTSSSANNYTVTITGTSSDDKTVTLSKAARRLDQFSGATFIGKCYNVATDDSKNGTVSVDGKKVL